MMRYRWTALLAALSIGPLAAEPIRAVLEDNQPGRQIKGDLRLDSGGGPVQGTVDITADVSPAGAPQRPGGPGPAGRYVLQVTLSGAYQTGTGLSGSAQLNGTFASAEGDARVTGAGQFSGTVSPGPRMLSVELVWPQVTYQGAGLTSPQPLRLRLPAFTYTALPGGAAPTTPVAPVVPPVAGTAPAVATPGAGGGDFSGLWETEQGPVVLMQEGTQVTGILLGQQRRLNGTIAGGVLRFRLLADDTPVGAGRCQLSADGAILTGTLNDGANPDAPGLPFTARRNAEGLVLRIPTDDQPAVVTPPPPPPPVVPPATGAQFKDIDLQTVRELQRVTLYFSIRIPAESLIELLVSDDKTAWRTVFRLQGGTVGGPELPLVITPQNVKARYVRIQCDAATFPLLRRYEWVVF